VNPTLIEVDRLLATAKFSHFVRLCWPAVSSDKFTPGYHLDCIVEHLQAVAEGQIDRLVINVAVRHSKSLLCSVLWPVWLWVRTPALRVITGSYSQQLTVRDAIRSRQLLESDLFKQHFPPIQLVDDSNRKDYYSTTSKGHRLSVSIGSRTAGFDADVIVADDIHDWQTRTSEAERTKAIDYFITGLMSRFVDKGKERAVLAGHRCHEDDVYARLRQQYGDDGTWTWLVLPEEYDSKFSSWYNAINWKDRRSEGELLWPERFNETVVAGEKKRYRHEYSAIFLQEPTPAEGTLFRKDWFKYWSEDAEGNYVLDGKRYPKASAWRYTTVDTAVSTSDTACYTVALTWDVIGQEKILVSMLRKRLDGAKIVPALARVYEELNPQFLCVEKEFVGKFVCDQLRERGVTVKPFSAKGHGDKETRAVAAEISMESGHVWFPANATWLGELEKEVLAFPNGTYSDAVDCLSMACILADKHKGRAEDPLTPEQQEQKVKKEAEERFTKMLWQGCPF
jgi:predicted phage terminase large subunit-like protein